MGQYGRVIAGQKPQVRNPDAIVSPISIEYRVSWNREHIDMFSQ